MSIKIDKQEVYMMRGFDFINRILDNEEYFELFRKDNDVQLWLLSKQEDISCWNRDVIKELIFEYILRNYFKNEVGIRPYGMGDVDHLGESDPMYIVLKESGLRYGENILLYWGY